MGKSRAVEAPMGRVDVVVQGASQARYVPAGRARRGSSGAAFSIRAFVGANGGGKTLAVVELCVLPAWEAGRLVVANLALYPERLGYAADLYRPLVSWRDIVKMGRCLEPDPCEPGDCPHTVTQGRGCLLVLDEASAALPSRQSGAVPAQLVRVLNQLRKRDVELVWTAPAYARMDVVVRECTQAVTVCSGLLPDRWQREVDPGERRWFPRRAEGAVQVDRAWAPNRLFTWATYEAMSYDEFTLGKTATLRPRSKRQYWRTRHDAMHAYGTLEGADLLDHLTDSGACMDCGLPRKRQNCSCGTEAAMPGGPSGPEASTAVPLRDVRRNGVTRLPSPARRLS